MPIATRNARAASFLIDLPFGRVFPEPDGAINQADRQQTGTKYPGLLVDPPPSGTILTRNNRAAALNLDLGFGRIFPEPDGALNQADRQQIGQKYPGLLVGAPAGGTLNTLCKRASSLLFDLPFARIWPMPDGTIAQADRQQAAYKYCSVLAGAPSTGAAAFTVYRPIFRPRRR